MVNYALVFQHDASLAIKIKQKLNTPPVKRSINHTDAQSTSFTPIAISMETEAAAVEEEDAHIQLGTWVHAHFARLQQLVPAGIQMPILPFIKDQDYNWKTMIAEKIGN